jgi:hypothetical protein
MAVSNSNHFNCCDERLVFVPVFDGYGPACEFECRAITARIASLRSDGKPFREYTEQRAGGVVVMGVEWSEEAQEA